MNKFWILIFVSIITTNSLDKAKSVQLEELPLQPIDEIFGEGWWDNEKAEDWHKITLEHDFHHEIDRQNTQIGQIEPNSTDQLGQIEPNSTDQNPPFTESDHSNNAKNEKFDQMKAELKRAGFKNSYKQEIDKTVAKELGLSLVTIYNWKRELGQTKPQHNHNEQKKLMKRYYEIKDQNLKKNDEDIAKMLKIGKRTLVNWKRQYKRQHFHPNSVDFVEENAAANVQEIGHSNSRSI
uniref:Uncharacterized protein n=1 Tax=Globodera rostochiensis TaxID=31243 RepID=A0A914HPB9_GLORO